MWRKGAKRGGKRGAAKRAPRRVPRAVKSKYNVPERASLTETVAWAGTGKCFTNTNYALNNVSLSQTVRARAVALGYQYFRISGITLKFKPLQDTFTQQANSPTQAVASVPHLYIMMDRTNRLATGGFNDAILRQLGAKPRRLDDKVLSFTYKPNVLTQTYDNNPVASTAVQYKISPWLPCRDDSTTSVWNPSTIDHLGVVFLADQDNGNIIQYQVEYVIQFEFKMPCVAVLTGDAPPVFGSEDILDISGNDVFKVPPE